jgi:cellulose synthase operon protein C
VDGVTNGARGAREGRRVGYLLWLAGLAAVVLCAWAISQASYAQQDVAALPPDQAMWAALARGDRAGAERLAAERPDVPTAAAVRARLAGDRGEYAAAIAILEPVAVAEPLSDAALELGLLYERVGRREDAGRVLATIYNRASSGHPELALRGGRAAQALNRPREANSLFRLASNVAPSPAAETAWGALFLERHDDAEAARSFQNALKLDDRWAPAHAGLARALARDNPPAAAAAAERALAIDPHLADAHLLLAGLELDNTRFDAARKRIDAVLAVNPVHLDARALAAAIAYVRDERQAFEAEVRRVLEINPGYGEVYRVAGELTARQYRFEEAVALTREAVALDPSNARAHADVGMHLMRTGDEDEARRSLDRAFRLDPYDLVTYNLLDLLDKLDKFEVFEEGDIILKLHPEEAPVLKDLAMPLAQEALKTLSERYRFKPAGPILVEIFPVHDDFAVRTLGLPGMIGALGACFGRVVIMDSPRARPPGSFSWEATLWHEMAHVFSLQMSRQRLPRWLSEGMAEFEETRARPAWGRHMQVPFAIALEQGRALKLADLNAGFNNPETIAIAYYQASLLVEHIIEAHGEDRLLTLVRSYADGAEGAEAVEAALGIPMAQLQASFDKAMDRQFGALRAALRERPSTGGAAGGSLTTLRGAALAGPNSYAAQLAYGQALAAEGDRAAFEPLEKAAALVPFAAGDDSPHAIMARLAEKLGDTDRAMREYHALLALDHTAVDPARRLAALAEKQGDDAALAHAYERVVAIDPFDAQGHTAVGRMALKRNEAVPAMRAFRAALALGPADKASAHCDLAESYLLAGRKDDAKREALAALEIAPTFERAQDLLLRAIDGAGSAR